MSKTILHKINEHPKTLNHLPKCQDCGQSIPIGKDLIYAGKPLCLECADKGYVICSQCGTVLSDEGDQQYYSAETDDYVCAECWQKLPRQERDQYIF